MKKVSILLLLLFPLAFSAYSQKWSTMMLDSDIARISFARDTLDYGLVKYKGNGYHEIKYANTGKCPLIIWEVSGLETRQAINNKWILFPGDSGIIKVYYPTNVPGQFFKKLSIFSNAQKEKQIIIKGTVQPEEICADMKIEEDDIDLGPVHYTYGKHFTIKFPSIGTCPLTFTVVPGDEYLNVINYNADPVKPGDSGFIEFHIGGQAVGNYYGTLDIYSSNGKTKRKSIMLKAELMPPDEPDSTNTKIAVATDIIDEGTVTKDEVTAIYTIKNVGKKALVFKSVDAGPAIMVKLPIKPIKSGKTDVIKVTYNMSNTVGRFIKHVNITGNFKGTTLPLYIKGYANPN